MLETLALNGDEIGKLEWFDEIGERIPLAGRTRGGHELLLRGERRMHAGARQYEKTGSTGQATHGN
jgi:hypothetical protein